MKVTEKAKEYAEGKSSASVFREQHQKDFIAGYNKAIEDSCADEMLQMLKELLLDIDEITIPTSMNSTIFKAKQLIKKATT